MGFSKYKYLIGCLDKNDIILSMGKIHSNLNKDRRIGRKFSINKGQQVVTDGIIEIYFRTGGQLMHLNGFQFCDVLKSNNFRNWATFEQLNMLEYHRIHSRTVLGRRDEVSELLIELEK